MNLVLRNLVGAFSDAAVLFPLLILLVAGGQFSPILLYSSAGIVYVLAGLYFRISMPVQPLKSIVIAGIALGASASEMRLSAALLGIACLVVLIFKLDSWMERVPLRVIQQVQFGLGALLLLQAIRTIGSSDLQIYGVVILLIGIMLLLPAWKGIPWMGLVAISGMIYMSIKGASFSAIPLNTIPQDELRTSVVLGLFFPQLALTFTNSVLGTREAAKVYFPRQSKLVTIKGLLTSIGIGNLFMALIGGLPFCHGSGGLTAHVKGGSNRWWSNVFIAVFLFLIAIQYWLLDSNNFKVPVVLVASLLFVTGIHHFRLAQETFFQRWGVLRLLTAFLIVILTQNLLYVLSAAFLMEFFEKIWLKIQPKVHLNHVGSENDFIR
ncbi:MAG: putative sulfate/molybdate transporter [Oligoflexia bacterium]|nr:putative sulfate/molybdate transporter [Oligoflexia bacterium]